MTDPARLFDSYNRQARLYPALLVLLPPLLLLLAWFPALENIGHLLITIAVACGLLFLLADFARTRGKKLEPILLKEWGGWPTTIWLRHSDSHLSAEVTRRYHAFLSRQPAIGVLPTQEDERLDPRRSDERYAASVVWLKEQCRGNAFPLVEKENATYGFRRNLLGLKSIGLVVCVATLLVPLFIVLVKSGFEVLRAPKILIGAYLTLPALVLGSLAFSVVALVGWLLLVNRHWVREAGYQYARALLANCDSLHG
jgi:hypothetical protein